MKVWPGTAYPLGATFDGVGTNFSIFSEVAEAVELCLFDTSGNETRVTLPEVTGGCWHGYFPELRPGQRYAYRVHGPWDPANGHRCNPAKLLLDPYSKAADGGLTWDDALFPYPIGGDDLARDERDSARFMPKSVVLDPFFDWTGDRQLHIPQHDAIIYETHVKGFTKRHPDIPEEIRGTYAALAHPATIEYLSRLHVNAVELMPVHWFVHDRTLVDRGLRNYWGYNSLLFFTPHTDYSSQADPNVRISEFRQMVRALHQAGIELILDVVYNHTAEGNHLGPILSFKGIDNTYYYRTTDDRRYYMDYTGTGNSLNMAHPHVLQLIMDSLRYWVTDMHVDGFRFDLAAALARQLHDVDRLSAFFDLIQQDPTVSQVKLIAEPWDVGDGGYQVGNFPPVWSEWNGRYRDCVRDFWRGTDRTLAEFAYRISGSPDLYESTTRRPFASVNFVTAHDGFTLQDLVSYNEKHNEANGEDDRDGESNNRSWNCGVEGPTDDPEIIALRSRQKRNFLATLLLSQGMPLLLGGDEIGRTQRGNNNGYCQDNELSWYDWTSVDQDLLEFVRRLNRFRDHHPAFKRRDWFQGRRIYGSDVADIAWFTPDGDPMSEESWNEGFAKSLGVYLNGQTIPNPFPKGEPAVDDTFYLMVNAHYEPVEFRLPGRRWGTKWSKELDSVEGCVDEAAEEVEAGGTVEIAGRCLALFRSIDAA